MNPEIWGSTLWKYLHLLSISYIDNLSKKEKDSYKLFLISLGKTLPCNICSKHYLEYMNDKTIDKCLQNKISFIKTIWDLHNQVNKRLNKPQYPFKKFLNDYNYIINKKPIEDNQSYIIEKKNIITNYKGFYYLILLLFLIIMFLFYLLYIKYQN